MIQHNLIRIIQSLMQLYDTVKRKGHTCIYSCISFMRFEQSEFIGSIGFMNETVSARSFASCHVLYRFCVFFFQFWLRLLFISLSLLLLLLVLKRFRALSIAVMLSLFVVRQFLLRITRVIQIRTH